MSKLKWKKNTIHPYNFCILSRPLLVYPDEILKNWSPHNPIFWNLYFPKKEEGKKNVYSFHLKIHGIIFASLRVPVGTFWCFLNVLLVLAMFNTIFCKDLPTFLRPNRTQGRQKVLFVHQQGQTHGNFLNQTNLKGCSVSGKSKFLGGYTTWL